MDRQEVVCGDMDWIVVSGQEQVAGSCKCRNETSGFIKCGGFLH
jgi:hypothetical protein